MAFVTGSNEQVGVTYKPVGTTSHESLVQEVRSLTVKVDELERLVSDHSQRFDTIQSPAWKRLVFRLDGWPVRDLNAKAPAWRPWRRWWRS